MTSVNTSAKDLELEAKLKTAFAAGELPGLHGVLVMQKDETTAEVYFEGLDQKWGVPLGRREHTADTLHDLRSVTKSIVGLLYGIALSEGKVPTPDECLVCQFPDYTDLAEDPQRRKILIRHALTMQMGTEWDEDLPYSDPRNSEIAMENSPDKYRYALDRPLVEPAGEKWVYNGGATTLIGHLIAKGTGIALDRYAEEKLFKPLGIEAHEWMGTKGEPSAASGLRLRAPDLAKIGTMVLAGGKFDDRQVVPSEWLEVSFEPHATTEDELRYGYQWWLAPHGNPPRWVAGFGYGGQRLIISPGLEAVTVIFAGNYAPKSWELPTRVLTEFIIPALIKNQ